MTNILTFNGQTLTDANIFGGLNFIADLNTGDEFSIGNTASKSVSFVTDIQLPLYTKDQVNGTFVWTQNPGDNLVDENNNDLIDDDDDLLTPIAAKGRYYITEVKKEKGRYIVTAYDAMILTETNISALSLSYPLTVSAAASAIATYIGCTVSGTIINGTASVAELDDDTSIRDLLGWVAEASGCSVKIDTADHLCFMYYDIVGPTITATEYKELGLEVADYTCAAIDKVVILNETGATIGTSGTGTNVLYVDGNPFLENATNTEAAAIYAKVSGLVYTPLKCEMFAENGVEVGTIVTFGSTQTLVMHLESSESGAIASSVGSDSRAEYNKSFETMLAVVTEEALEAAKTASKYITKIDNSGIKVHAYDDANHAADNSNYSNITSDGLEVYQNSTSVAKFGSSARIGQDAYNHIEVTPSATEFYSGSGSNLGSIGLYNSGLGMYSDGGIIVAGDAGVTVFGSSGGVLDVGQTTSVQGNGYVSGTFTSNGAIVGNSSLDTNGNITSHSNIEAWASVKSGTYFNSTYTLNNPGGGTTANLYVAGNGNILKTAGSSKRFKKNIKDANPEEFDPHGLYDLRFRQFRYRSGYFGENAPEEMYKKLYQGFIAEEVQEAYPAAAVIDENGKVETWSDRELIPPMLALIQEQHKEIEALRAEIAAIKERITE